MVLTVTLNPLLEKKLFFDSIGNSTNRAAREVLTAGGKGINISRQLSKLGIHNHALLYLGGSNGKKLRSILTEEQISFSAVSTKSETRDATLVFDESEQKLITYLGINSEISKQEIDQFLIKLEKAIINASIVVFAGSLPNPESASIIMRGIELCHKNDKISILDTYGTELNKFLQLGPTLFHNNLSEMRSSLSLSLDKEDEIKKLLNRLYSNNIKLVFLTAGKEPTFASKSDFHYKIENPRIEEKNATGSGDAFVAGIIYGLEKSMIFNDFVKLGTALGAVNSSRWDVCSVSMAEAETVIDQVKITEIGKKIKIIDDSPTI